MKQNRILAIAMDHFGFLKDSDGRLYFIPEDTPNTKEGLNCYLNKLCDKFVEISNNRKIFLLSDILTPNSHCIYIDPSSWYLFLSNLVDKTKKSNNPINIIHDRGTTSTHCSNCRFKNKYYTVKLDKWICPDCDIEHDTTDNILKNIIHDYNFDCEIRNKTKEYATSKEVDIYDFNQTYLFSRILKDQEPVRFGPYKFTTDEYTEEFIRTMDLVARNIREEIVCSIKNNDDQSFLNYKGWVNEWYNKYGRFSKYRKIRNVTLAFTSIADTIINTCHLINTTKILPELNDPIRVVYWRNNIVDKIAKRVAFPRFRGSFIQLEMNAIIPTGRYFSEITIDQNDNMCLYFVMSGNHPPKYESLDGSLHRVRHQRLTRKPRSKFITPY